MPGGDSVGGGAVLKLEFIRQLSLQPTAGLRSGEREKRCAPTAHPTTHGITTEKRIDRQSAALIAEAIATPAQRIPGGVRQIIEARTGVVLGDIAIHIGWKAAAAAKTLRARAFSVSRHIVFGEHEFCPDSENGLRLLLHEIAHAVRQTDSPEVHQFFLSVDRRSEWFADAFAAHVLDGPSQRPLLPFPPAPNGFPPAPNGLVFRHAAPECPGPQLGWVPDSAEPLEISQQANRAIELAYTASHNGHVIIFGGDFTPGMTITLPRDGKLSDIDRQFGNNLLLELKGLQHQLRPDIIDFTERKLYEIKTNEVANRYPSKCVDQLANYYKIIETIRVKYSGPEWSPLAPDWYPSHTLPFGVDPNRLVCTSATMYMYDKEHLNTLNRPGLIRYRVLKKVRSEEDRKKRAQEMHITELAPELQEVRPLFERALRASLPEADDREYLIVCTQEFVDTVLVPVGTQNIARTLSLLAVPALNVYRNPVIMLRFLGWSVILTSQILGFTAFAASVGGVAVAPGAAIAPAAVPGSTAVVAGTPALIQVPEAIASGMRAANDVYKAAAGILFLVGTTAVTTDVRAATIKFDHIGAVRAIPVHSTRLNYGLSTGVKIDWAGSEYFYLGRASSTT
jgi:hypothetical protein